MRRMLLGVILLAGCAPSTAGLKGPTSGSIGCPPGQIIITDDTGGWSNPRTWTATCAGKTFYCMGDSTSMKANCKEGIVQPGPGAPPAKAPPPPGAPPANAPPPGAPPQ